MRRALGGLLLSTSKARADKCSPHFCKTHNPADIQRHQQPHQIHAPFFTSTSATSHDLDPHTLTFITSSYPAFPPASFHLDDVKLAARHYAPFVVHGDLHAEKIAVRGFSSHDVAHCELSIEEDASEDSPRCIASQDCSTSDEAQKLLKLKKLEDLKRHMHGTGKHYIPLEEVMKLCKQTGTAIDDAVAEELLKTLDEAGEILIFRRKVFLEPKKVAEVLSRAMPLPLAQEDDPRNQEFSKLQKEKEDIDRIAHKQVRRMLWETLGALSTLSAVFLRLTFWDFSWDVMEPIAFFVTSGSLLAGFFFFVITKRDPSYHDFMDTLFSSKQRKLMKKRNFDLERFKELQVMCCLQAGGQNYLPTKPHGNHEF